LWLDAALLQESQEAGALKEEKRNDRPAQFCTGRFILWEGFSVVPTSEMSIGDPHFGHDENQRILVGVRSGPSEINFLVQRIDAQFLNLDLRRGTGGESFGPNRVSKCKGPTRTPMVVDFNFADGYS
jgi:hypothetical protein